MQIEQVTPKTLYEIERKPIYHFLEEVDDDFYPALSKRPGGIRAFINEFILHQGEIFVYKNPNIIAAIGYWYRGERGDDCYCHLLAVLKDYRKSRIGYTLLDHAFKTIDTSRLSIVSVRTWPDNVSTINFAKGLGFELVKEYYEPDMNRNSLLFEMEVDAFRKSLNALFPKNR